MYELSEPSIKSIIYERKDSTQFHHLKYSANKWKMIKTYSYHRNPDPEAIPRADRIKF